MEADKLGHLVVGLWLAAASGVLTKRWYLGILVALFAGAGKEAYDSLGYGTVEFMDFVATVVGGTLGGAIAYGLNRINITGEGVSK